MILAKFMVWIFCFFALILTGCQQKSQERQYTEINTAAHQGPVCPLAQSVAHGMRGAPLSWVIPEGWSQKAATPMRMASFYLVSSPEAIDCSIIALRGSAGGLEANLARWAQQIGLEASSDNLKYLNDSAESLNTQDGLEVKVFDFSGLAFHAKGSGQSMMVAPIALDDMTVFVKMTGCVESVKQNRNSFLKLIRSIVRP
ncbi:MAG: hypothetical protein HQL13_03835 [Candidatus Omnitrophica bacterium]|nr:hypothetical protein [Candidatus Omnitrophota bacterium]